MVDNTVLIKRIQEEGLYITTNCNGEDVYQYGNLLFKINEKGEVLGTILEDGNDG